MADMPRTWQILEALKARLQEISIANGFRTDAGYDVRLERTDGMPAAPYLTLYSNGKVRPAGATRGEREFTLVVEAIVPTALANAHRLVVDITEDIEDALDLYLQQPFALPLSFEESAYLDTPEGLPAMASQTLFTTRYRR